MKALGNWNPEYEQLPTSLYSCVENPNVMQKNSGILNIWLTLTFNL